SLLLSVSFLYRLASNNIFTLSLHDALPIYGCIGCPFTFVFILNKLPACGYCSSVFSFNPTRAVVIYNSSRLSPPKQHEVTSGDGIFTDSRNSPVFGFHLQT